MELKWREGFTISVRVENDGAVVLAANREGMLSLANHFAALAEEPPGSHIHFDEANSLEENSVGLIVERRE